MSTKHVGKQSVAFENPPSIAGNACIAGKFESEGPLRNSFDYTNEDSFFGEKSWEKAESIMHRMALNIALDKASLAPSSVEYIFAGDLLNQCIGSTFGLRELAIPFFGIFGACSTMAEGLALASMTIDGGFADCTAVSTSSHFCTAERQFRYPLEYGGVRAPTAQRTVTAAGAVILTADGEGPYITHATCGRIIDQGIKDANNMGAAMAPAAYDTITTHLNDLALKPSDYDLIVTGDLASVGSEILIDLFHNDGIDIAPYHTDCGLMIFSLEEQNVQSGGSGCGCAASVLAGHLLNGMRGGRWNRILFAATGALMSTTSSQQGESIPGICFAVSISNTR